MAADTLNGVPVLRLSGTLAYGQDLEALHDGATRLRTEGHQRVILDLAALGWTDSTGVTALLEVRQIISPQPGSVILLRPSKRLRSTLEMTHVASLFEIVEHDADPRLRRAGC